MVKVVARVPLRHEHHLASMRQEDAEARGIREHRTRQASRVKQLVDREVRNNSVLHIILRNCKAAPTEQLSPVLPNLPPRKKLLQTSFHVPLHQATVRLVHIRESWSKPRWALIHRQQQQSRLAHLRGQLGAALRQNLLDVHISCRERYSSTFSQWDRAARHGTVIRAEMKIGSNFGVRGQRNIC